MLFELRQYRMRPGMREAWVKMMEEEIIPFQTSKGIVIVGSFVGEEEDDLYIWIRRFDSEAERERLYEAVYESGLLEGRDGAPHRRAHRQGAHGGHEDGADRPVGPPLRAAWTIRAEASR